MLLSSGLTPEETDLLVKSGLDPADFAAIVTTAQAVQLGPREPVMPPISAVVRPDASGKQHVILAVATVIPYDTLPLPISRLVTPSGTQHTQSNAFAMPPQVRCVVRRDALSEEARQTLAGVAFSAATAATAQEPT